MGFFKNLLGGGESESEQISADFEDEIESQVEEVDDDMGDPDDWDEDPEPEVKEWDSAYRFVEEYLEVRGFADNKDFIVKAMFYQINNSPMYRDRIQSGVETMNMVSQATQQIEQIRGGNDDNSLQEQAEKIQHANQVIDGVQKLSGEEEQMVNDIIGLGYHAVEQIGSSAMGGGGNMGGVDSSVNVEDGEM